MESASVNYLGVSTVCQDTGFGVMGATPIYCSESDMPRTSQALKYQFIMDVKN